MCILNLCHPTENRYFCNYNKVILKSWSVLLLISVLGGCAEDAMYP